MKKTAAAKEIIAATVMKEGQRSLFPHVRRLGMTIVPVKTGERIPDEIQGRIPDGIAERIQSGRIPELCLRPEMISPDTDAVKPAAAKKMHKNMPAVIV